MKRMSATEPPAASKFKVSYIYRKLCTGTPSARKSRGGLIVLIFATISATDILWYIFCLQFESIKMSHKIPKNNY